MEKNGELKGSMRAIKNVVDSKSWFRDTPHYWAEASLPLAYAVACVEVVCKNSEKTGTLYSKPHKIMTDSYGITAGQTMP